MGSCEGQCALGRVSGARGGRGEANARVCWCSHLVRDFRRSPPSAEPLPKLSRPFKPRAGGAQRQKQPGGRGSRISGPSMKVRPCARRSGAGGHPNSAGPGPTDEAVPLPRPATAWHQCRVSLLFTADRAPPRRHRTSAGVVSAAGSPPWPLQASPPRPSPAWACAAACPRWRPAPTPLVRPGESRSRGAGERARWGGRLAASSAYSASAGHWMRCWFSTRGLARSIARLGHRRHSFWIMASPPLPPPLAAAHPPRAVP